MNDKDKGMMLGRVQMCSQIFAWMTSEGDKYTSIDDKYRSVLKYLVAIGQRRD